MKKFIKNKKKCKPIKGGLFSPYPDTFSIDIIYNAIVSLSLSRTAEGMRCYVFHFLSCATNQVFDAFTSTLWNNIKNVKGFKSDILNITRKIRKTEEESDSEGLAYLEKMSEPPKQNY